MQNTIRVTATGSLLQVLALHHLWASGIALSFFPPSRHLLPQTGTELSGFCRFSNGQPPSSMFHRFKAMASCGGSMVVPASWYYPRCPPLNSMMLLTITRLALPLLIPLHPDPPGCRLCLLGDVGYQPLPSWPFNPEQSKHSIFKLTLFHLPYFEDALLWYVE